MTDLPIPNIPLPVIERQPAFETYFNARIEQMRGLLADAGVAWDTYMLRSDPINRICRHAAYGDLLYVQALNDTFRATLLDFGAGADLDAQASDWGLARETGESDDDLRRRLRERKKGQGGFTDNWYKRWAFEASPQRVADVGIAQDAKGGVAVSILSKDNAGVADEALLTAVAAKLNDPLVVGENDHVSVVPAVIRIVNVKAKLWLLPEAPATAIQDALANLSAKFEAERRLGWDFSADWAIANLRATGVRRVVLEEPSPNEYVPVAPNEAVALGTVNIEYMGRSY